MASLAPNSSRRNANSFPCAQCNHVYPFEFSLTNHIKKEHAGNFECYNCGSIAKSAIGLMQHMKLHHVKKEPIEKEEAVVEKALDEPKKNPQTRTPVEKTTVDEQMKNPVEKTKNFSQINWDQNDSTIPKGWKISTNYEFQLYLSPSGRFFKSRELACSRMIEEGNHSAEDFQLMKTGVKSEWVESPNIPQGWKINIGNGAERGDRFKSPDGVFIFQSRKDAFNYMIQKGGYSSKDIELMSQKNTNAKKQSDWLENDPTVPAGWKVKTSEVKLKNGISKTQLFKINKKVFDSRQAAFAFMVACRSYSTEDLELMKTGEKTKWDDGDETLPTGWKIRSSNNGKIFWFKSPDGKIFYSRESAYVYMKKSGGFSEVDIKLMRSGIQNIKKDELKNGEIKQKIVWSNGDGKLPNGWKLRIVDKKRTIYMSPDRNMLSSVMQCLQFMLKRKYAKKEILFMAENLLEDGWEINQNIPMGWYMKKDRDGASINFLTDEFKLLLGVTDALNFMTNSDRYSNIDMERLLMLMKVVFSLPPQPPKNKDAKLYENAPDCGESDKNIHKEIKKEATMTPPKETDNNVLIGNSGENIYIKRENIPPSISNSINEEAIPFIHEIPSLKPSASLVGKKSNKKRNFDQTGDVEERNAKHIKMDNCMPKVESNLIKMETDEMNKLNPKLIAECDQSDQCNAKPLALSDETDKCNPQPTEIDETDKLKPTEVFDETDKFNPKPTEISDETAVSSETDIFSPKSMEADETDKFHKNPTATSDETEPTATFDETEPSAVSGETDKFTRTPTEVSDETAVSGETDIFSPKSMEADETDKFDKNLTATSDETKPTAVSCETDKFKPNPQVASDTVSQNKIELEHQDNFTFNEVKLATLVEPPELNPETEVKLETSVVPVEFNPETELSFIKTKFSYEFLTDEHERNFLSLVNEFKMSIASDNEE